MSIQSVKEQGGNKEISMWFKGITARSIMSPHPITVTTTTTYAEAIKLLEQNAIRHLPVVEDGEIVGIVSDRDIKEISGFSISDISEDPSGFQARLQTPIGSIYHSDFISVSPDTELEEIVDVLLEEKIGAVPVVDSHSLQVMGIVSYIDVLQAVKNAIESN